MNEPKPLYRCDLCKSVDYEDPVIGCKKCGFDEMRPIDSKEASKPPPTPGPSDERLTNEDMSRLRNDLPNFYESEFVARILAALASTPNVAPSESVAVSGEVSERVAKCSAILTLIDNYAPEKPGTAERTHLAVAVDAVLALAGSGGKS